MIKQHVISVVTFKIILNAVAESAIAMVGRFRSIVDIDQTT